MAFTILIYETPADFAARTDPAQQQAYWARLPPYIAALREAGVLIGGAGLEPPATATFLKQRNGQATVQDGPYAEAKERLAGYFIVDVPDRDTALAWAARYPVTTGGTVEVRPNLPPMH